MIYFMYSYVFIVLFSFIISFHCLFIYFITLLHYYSMKVKYVILFMFLHCLFTIYFFKKI
jgi:hypothetical protein